MMRDVRPTWFIDELSYAGRENLDAEHVARYDGKEDAARSGWRPGAPPAATASRANGAAPS
jgi:hypothetical protein